MKRLTVGAGFVLVLFVAGCALTGEDRARVQEITTRIIALEKIIEQGVKDGTLTVADAKAAVAELKAAKDELEEIKNRAGASWAEILGTVAASIVTTLTGVRIWRGAPTRKEPAVKKLLGDG